MQTTNEQVHYLKNEEMNSNENMNDIMLFKQLQLQFEKQFPTIFSESDVKKTIVIIPSLTLDMEILQKVRGAHYYEERLLCMLMLLKKPYTNIVYLTSLPIDPVILDYYLHLLPGITSYHARQRLTLLSCYDSSKTSLTEKVLKRPRLIEKIKQHIPNGNMVYLSCFNVTEHERKLAIEIGVPIYGCDPDLIDLGNKSNSRKIFKACDIHLPKGFEDLRTEDDIVNALVALKLDNNSLNKAVIKINDGFSGEGNAVFSYSGANLENMTAWTKSELPERIQIVAEYVSYADFIKKFNILGGIVEEFVEGEIKKTPSVQCGINPVGEVEIVSTHDQITGGESGQVFLGATFPALSDYAVEIGRQGRVIAEKLKQLGVIGRLAVDFISVWEQNTWKHYAIEINLRKGGTTHPYMMLQFLTEGKYDHKTGVYTSIRGESKYYTCSDNLQSDAYKGLGPDDLIDIAMCNDLLFNVNSQEGVMFHLISTLSQYGKIGVVCIGDTPEKADMYFFKTKAVLDRECLKNNR